MPLNSTTQLRLKRAMQGVAMGLAAGFAGALGMTMAFDGTPLPLLGIVTLVPAITGLLYGLFSKAPRATLVSQPSPQPDSRIIFGSALVHLGTRLGLHAFLLRFGLSNGFLKKIIDNPNTPPNQKTSGSQQQKIINSIELQYPTVTTITYDIQTNAPNSDTIARDQLSSTRMALLSMDHTKQIPH